MLRLKKRRYRVAWDGHTLADPERLMEMERAASGAGGYIRLCLYEPAWEGGYFTFLAEFDHPRTAGKVSAELWGRLFPPSGNLAGAPVRRASSGKEGQPGAESCAP